MSQAEAAAVHEGSPPEDCPLCLEPLPPFWDMKRQAVNLCCGQAVCKDCNDKKNAYLHSAHASGSYGREEEQLNNCCPLCRAPTPTRREAGRMLAERFEKGDELPLTLYCDLGMYFINGQDGVERNVERGMEILMLGAEKGDPNCQYLIGIRYQEGVDGLPKSLAEAKRWYLAATEQGHAIAEYNLAFIFGDEEGNDAEYLRYLRGSASKGYDDACYNLGLAHYNGEGGLERSTEEAINAVTPAAERGDAKSMGLLGYIMCFPDPLAPPTANGKRPNSLLMPPYNPTFTKGMHWLRRAAAKGDQTSIANLKINEGGGQQHMFKVQKAITVRGGIPAMLEVPRGVVLQQRLPATALESSRSGAQAVLHQMELTAMNKEWRPIEDVILRKI